MLLLRNVDYFIFAFAWNAERFACVLLHFVTLSALSRISGTSEQKLVLQGIVLQQLVQYTALEIKLRSWE